MKAKETINISLDRELWDELTLSSREFENKQEAEEFLKKKVIETARKYKIRADPHTLGKYQYYITRDFLNFAKIDGFMRDENIEDISCDGVGQPLYVWHRVYESIQSNAAFKTQEELDSFILKLAYLCGRHVSIAQPILDGSLPDGSRAQLTYGKEVTPKGSTFTIRKFKKSPLTITDLIARAQVHMDPLEYVKLEAQTRGEPARDVHFDRDLCIFTV